MIARAREQHGSRVGWLACACVLVGLVCAGTSRGVTVGLYFVEGADEPIDFLNPPDFEPGDLGHYIQPWQLTDSGNQFVLDGALLGVSEEQVRADVIAAVKQKFYDVPTPTGYALDIDLLPQKVSGSGTVNVLIGQHNVTVQQWFGFSQLGGGMGAEANGQSNAAVSVNRIDALLQADFTEYHDAVNAVANVVAHETAHLFWLEHVWADERPDLGWDGEPVVTNPYDTMATGPSGLPDAGWLEDNIFTSVPNTQTNGHSSASLLVENIGLRLIGDTDRDSDVDNVDIGTTTGNFTGSVGAAGGKLYLDGDMDFDGDVDNVDIGTVTGAFTGSLAGNLTDTLGVPDLIYDPTTGHVTVDTEGLALTSFQFASGEAGAILAGNYLSPAGCAADLFGLSFEQLTDDVIGDSDGLNVGFTGLHNFGDIFPAGMDLAGLEAYLSIAFYGTFGAGSGSFDLAVVPEPATVALLGVGGMWILRRRAA